MSEFELNTLLIEYSAAIDSQFNFWMAATFAIVIASHTTGDKLNRPGRLGLVLLYLLACSVFYLRYLGAVDQVTYAIEQLLELGRQSPSPELGIATRLVRQMLLAIGTIFAVVVVVWPALLKVGTQPSNES
jgi:hypothetical protein